MSHDLTLSLLSSAIQRRQLHVTWQEDLQHVITNLRTSCHTSQILCTDMSGVQRNGKKYLHINVVTPHSFEGDLTAVGPDYGNKNLLFTLQGEHWIDKLHPMQNGRCNAAVVNTSDAEYIIVIGGSTDGKYWLSVVELFHLKSRRWYKLTDLPKHLSYPSATICGDQLYVIGGDGDYDDGYSCSLKGLPTPLQLRPDTNITLSWSPLPLLPVTATTAASLCGQLVLVGGVRDKLSVTSIYQLLGEEWVEIGSMSIDRGWCLVVSPSSDKLMIIGGLRVEWSSDEIDTIEECNVVQ